MIHDKLLGDYIATSYYKDGKREFVFVGEDIAPTMRQANMPNGITPSESAKKQHSSPLAPRRAGK